MKAETLYDDKEITLEKFEDGTYRITIFDEHNHWAGDFDFDKEGIIHDDLTEDKKE